MSESLESTTGHGGKREGAGRKPAHPSGAVSRVPLYLAPAERLQLEELAADAGLTPSRLIAAWIVSHGPLPSDDPPAS